MAITGKYSKEALAAMTVEQRLKLKDELIQTMGYAQACEDIGKMVLHFTKDGGKLSADQFLKILETAMGSQEAYQEFIKQEN